MGEWIPIGDDFIKADVIRWHEGVFKPRRSRKGRSIKLGERRVTAEVLAEAHEDGWVHVLVRGWELISETPGRRMPALPLRTEIKRALKTILRGKPERLLWSDESARAIVASKFLNNRGLESERDATDEN